MQRAILIAFAGILSIPLACIATATPCDGGSGRARFSWEAVADPIVSGYKVHWGTASGVYTHSYDAGNVTEVIIAAFAEGVEYFSAVMAYSATGEESDYSEEVAFVYDTTDRVVFLEAENGVLTSPMNIFGDDSTSWVAASPADPAAVTTLSFTTPYASDYYVWCRVLAPSTSADSMWVTVDEQLEVVYDIYGEASPPAAAYQPGWHWSRIQISPDIVRAFALNGGAHSIRFRCLENTPLDRVIIVSNPDFIPTDTLPHNCDFVEVVGQPQGAVVVEGGALTLTATLVATGPLSVQWFHDGVPVPNSSQLSLSLSNVQASDGGAYTLSASINSATVTTQPAILTIVPEPIESWRALSFSSEHITAGQAADDMDPDQDGLVNLAEYALGTNPLVSTPPLTAVKNSEGLVLTFKRPRGLSDVLYAAYSSDDLIHWNPCVLEMVADGPVQTMRAIDPLTSGNPARRFISLRFTKP